MSWNEFINQPVPSLLAKGANPDDWYQLFDKIASRKIWDETLAQTCSGMALDVIRANDFAKLGPFENAQNPESYLRVVFTRELIEAHRAIVGRCQPNKAIKDLGEPYLRLHNLLCCKHKEPEEISRQEKDSDYPPPVVLEMLKMIKQLDRNCGRKVGPAPLPNVDEDGEEKDPIAELPEDPSNSPEAEYYRALLIALKLIYEPGAYKKERETLDEMGKRLADQCQQIIEQIAFTTDERLFLKMRYQFGKTIKDIARVHQLDYNYVRNSVKTALNKAKSAFNAAGFDFIDFKILD